MLRLGSSGDAVRALQDQLRAAGFDPGASDGVFGARTQAAVRAFQQARGLAVDGIVGPQTQAKLTPAAPAGAAPAAVPAVGLNDTPYAWMMQIPEVAAVLNQWQAGGYDDAWLKGHVEATSWWRSSSDAQRQWQQLTTQDPATAMAKRNQMSAHIDFMAQSMGIIPAPGFNDLMADRALRYGLSDDQIKAQLIPYVTAGVNATGQAATIAHQYSQIANDYLVPISDATMTQWARSTLSGEQNQDSFLSYAKEQAKSLFPGLASAIDQGVTVRQYADPYVQLAAKDLNIAPDSVNLMDPKWRRAIDQIDPQSGNHTAMSLTDWERTLKTDSSYGYDTTPGARQEAASLATKLAQTFGAA